MFQIEQMSVRFCEFTSCVPSRRDERRRDVTGRDFQHLASPCLQLLPLHSSQRPPRAGSQQPSNYSTARPSTYPANRALGSREPVLKLSSIRLRPRGTGLGLINGSSTGADNMPPSLLPVSNRPGSSGGHGLTMSLGGGGAGMGIERVRVPLVLRRLGKFRSMVCRSLCCSFGVLELCDTGHWRSDWVAAWEGG